MDRLDELIARGREVRKSTDAMTPSERWSVVRAGLGVQKGEYDGTPAAPAAPPDGIDPEALERGVKQEMAEHGLDRATATKMATDHLRENPQAYAEGTSTEAPGPERAPDGTQAHEASETPAEEAAEHASVAEAPDEGMGEQPADQQGPEDAVVPRIEDIFRAWLGARTGQQMPDGMPEYVQPNGGETAGQFADRLADALAKEPEYHDAVASVGEADWRDYVTAIGKETLTPGGEQEAAETPAAEATEPEGKETEPMDVMKSLDVLISRGKEVRKSMDGAVKLTGKECLDLLDRDLCEQAKRWAKRTPDFPWDADCKTAEEYIDSVVGRQVASIAWSDSQAKAMREVGGIPEFDAHVRSVLAAELKDYAPKPNADGVTFIKQ